MAVFTLEIDDKNVDEVIGELARLNGWTETLDADVEADPVKGTQHKLIKVPNPEKQSTAAKKFIVGVIQNVMAQKAMRDHQAVAQDAAKSIGFK